MAKKISKVRKQEIVFKRSLFRFSVAFIFILIAGLVSKYFISQIPIEQKVLEALHLPDHYELELHNPHFEFSQGLMPVIGVAFGRVEFYETRCISKRVMAHEVLLVLNPWKLMQGELKLGWAKIGFLELDYPENCGALMASDQVDSMAKQGASSPVWVKGKASPKGKGSELQDQIVKEVFAHVQKIKELNKLSYLIVDSFVFRGLRSMTDLFVAKGHLSAKLKDVIDIDLRLKDFVYKEKKVPLKGTNFNISVDERTIQADLKSNIREGDVRFSLRVDNTINYPTFVTLSLEKVPVSSLSSLFFKENQISYLWNNCQIKLKSDWKGLFAKPLQVSDCGFDGPYGNVVLSEVKATLQKVDLLKAEFNKLDLDQIAKSKRNLFLSGVFSKYGVLSSQLIYKDKKVAIEGFLQNADFMFSNNNLRDIQSVSKIPFFFKGDEKRWQAVVSEVELDGGEFEGDIKVQMSPQEKQAQGKISIHKLKLNSKIYKLMLEAQPATLKLYGKFSLSDGEVKTWSSLLVTPLLKSPQYEFSNLKVRGKSGEDGSADVNISIGRGTVAKDAPLVDWLQPTTLGMPLASEKIKFKELSTRVQIAKQQKIFWKRGYARLDNGWQLSTEGTRDHDRKIQAWIQWDKPNSHYLKWDYQGQFFSGKWIPITAWVKEWLDKNPQYLSDHQSLSYQAVKQESLGTKINEVGKKAIDKVKSVLSTESEQKAQQ